MPRSARRVRGPSRMTFAWALALLAALAGGLAAEDAPPDPRLAKVTELEAVQNKVAFLEKEVTDRESRVKELEEELKRRPEKPAAGGGGAGLPRA